ncbi:MAG: hypothetical protein V1670_03200 [Candidatus Omnitrophota bacterium]
MLKKNKKGQSILEYVIVLTAVVAVLVWAGATLIKPAVETGFNDTTNGVDAVSNKLADVSAP